MKPEWHRAFDEEVMEKNQWFNEDLVMVMATTVQCYIAA